MALYGDFNGTHYQDKSLQTFQYWIWRDNIQSQIFQQWYLVVFVKLYVSSPVYKWSILLKISNIVRGLYDKFGWLRYVH